MRSLRARLTLGVGLVIAVVLGVSGVLIANYAERTAREALDDRLRRTAELSSATAVDAVQNAVPGTDRRLDAVLSATGSSLRLFIDDAVVTVDGATAAETSFEDDLGGWSVSGAPEGSGANDNDWTRSQLGFEEGAAVTTDDTVYTGFGAEGLTTQAMREDFVARSLGHLLGG